jgi:KDO2-lipid IV(A) lauroyltransferase
MYAEVAFHGQQRLQQGAVIHIVGDTAEKGPGVTIRFFAGNREYTVRTGFAELALNTGAAIIPAYGRFLEDGRLLTHLAPPLQAAGATRTEQVTSLVQQYGDFVDGVIRAYPEVLRWRKMANHLRHPLRPRAEG